MPAVRLHAARSSCLFHWSGSNASDARVGALVGPGVDPVSGEPEYACARRTVRRKLVRIRTRCRVSAPVPRQLCAAIEMRIKGSRTGYHPVHRDVIGLRKNRAKFCFRVADADGQRFRIQLRESSIKESSPIPQPIALEVTRCESRGLVQRRPNERDGREVEVHLLAKGERLLIRLASLHRAELKASRNVFPVPVIED